MKLKHLILAAAVLCGASAQAQTNPLFRYIQPGSRMVMSFNLLKIAAKVPGETFRQSGLYKDMMKDDKGELRAFFNNPSSTGIDFSTDFILSMIQSGDTAASKAVPVLYGHIKDQALFASLMKKMNKDEDRIQVFGNNRLVMPKSVGPALAWNDEIFIITGSADGKNELNKIFSDTTDTRDMEVRMKEVTERLNHSLREQCFKLLSPSADFGSPVFKQLMSEAGDIRIWNNGRQPSTDNNAFRKMPAFITQFMSRIQSANGTEKTSIINFENGKIAGTMRNYINPELGAVYQKYPEEELPTDLVRRLPEGKILMMMMTSVNPEKSKEIMAKNGMGDLLDSLNRFLKLDAGAFKNAFKNKMLFSVLELPSKEAATDKKKNPLEDLGLFIVMPVLDKAVVARLKELADRKLDSVSNTEKGEKMMSLFRPVIKFNDNLCVITLNEAMADAYLENPGTASLPAWLPANQHTSMWMNLNFREIMNMLLSKAGKPGKGKDQQVQTMLATFDQLIISGGEYANGSLNSRMEFRFSDPDKNALQQFFEMANRLSQEKAEARAEKFTPPVIVQDEEVKDAPAAKKPAPKKAPVKKPATKTTTKTKG